MKAEADYPLSRGMVGQSSTADLQESAAVFEKRMLNIVSFADMGLNAEEIKIGLAIEVREDVSHNEINSILATAITKGRLPKEGYSGENDVSLTNEEQLDKVLRRLIAREMLPEEKAKMIHGKEEWDRVIESMGDIDKPLGIVKKLLGRGAALPDGMQIAQLEHTPTKDPIIRFAQDLAGEGIVGEDLSNYFQLRLILNENHIRLPDFAHVIILESLLAVRKGIRTQDLTLLSTYQELRDKSFNEEFGEQSKKDEELERFEDFIGEIDESLEYRVDNEGLYGVGINGEQLRTPLYISDMGQVVFDNAVLRGQRNRSRKQTTEGRRQGKLTKTMKSVTAWETRNPLEVKH
ncbi:MAG: hypothetical protein A3B41_00530 [Candidatus Levybacteria bacterium RIFCSPLOWO2_01_FULL_37_26]|nr:MAG: hypothetical protein A3B41_00530 [Candidatus Levybacteria bacterium RIFCSPLOWO2_01_FULL_37_26]